MRIGVIGLCGFTMDFVNKAVDAGHQVLLSSTRENRQFQDLEMKLGENVKLVTRREAAEANILILFIPREDVGMFLTDLPDMDEKILIHASNPIFSLECLRPNSKASCEIIASLLPEAHMIKVLNIVNPNVLTLLNQKHKEKEVFYVGGNEQAKNKAKAFFKSLNLDGVDFEELYQLPVHSCFMN
ncbi:NAD(P)-binding domain-containing protein [Flavobacterium sharifuzzamanii]|uniref:NAD(P)-binding domain-containing protein n=1 Tax=Flavobacterium sharifuzzamanii TaxID=2211133 RepID=UPI000DAD3DD6|nr:NAD(P)-binding domain-containing protein [Flavobacterium sharifuzzamanii]KAF2082312.1 NAD(P)-binding domain-containing protein [Flavobacterium sharifuzzamanii]